MAANTYCAYNKTRQSFLCAEATVIDSVLDPLRVLKVLIEGLDPDTEPALYLQRFSGVPVAGTLSAFDLIYLDRNNRVIHGVALSPDYEAMPFRGRAEAALVLPSGSIARSRTSTGDELLITVVKEVESEPELTSAAAAEQGAESAESFLRATPGEELILTVAEETESQPEPAPPATISQEVVERPEGALQTRSNDELIFVVADEAVSLSEPVPISTADEHAADKTGAAAEPLPDQSGIESPAAGEGVVEQRPSLQQLDAKQEAESAAEQDSLEDELRRLVAGKPGRKEVKDSPDQWDSMEAELRRSIAQRENRLKHIRIWTSAPPNRPPALKDALKAPFLSSADWAGNAQGKAPSSSAAAPASQQAQVPVRKESLKIRLLRRIDYFLRWLDYAENEPEEIEQEEEPDQRRGQRLSFPNMVAFCWTGGLPKPFKVGNISVSGFYLITDDRWSPGTILKMTLQSANATGENPRDAITVHAKVVRLGPDGEGFEFVLTKLLE
ncbi:MAG: hypothetical protein KGM96_03090 [Acidobacteriota bacterium]|nr:hypothetical protein [Acidobacteriota bacterium]